MDQDKDRMCQYLDKVVIEFFDILEALYQHQAKMEQQMRDGYLSLSRARYTMGGTRNVGMLQFAENELEMQALREVEVLNFPDEKSGEKENTGRSHLSDIKMNLIDKRLQKENSVENDDISKTETVRWRHVRKEVAERERQGETSGTERSVGSVKCKEKDGSKTNEINGCKKAGVKDPIHLFGYLVSPHLRRSQASFEQATATSVEIANLKNKLTSIKKEYEEMLMQKRLDSH